MRRAVAAGIAGLALVIAGASPASASDPAKDRQAAQSRANAAASRMANAEAALATVEAQVRDLEASAGEARSRLDALEQRVRAVAVSSYMRGGHGVPFVLDADITRAARANALARFVTLGDTDAIDGYRAARDDLAGRSAALRHQLGQRKAAAAALQKQRDAAYAELHRVAAAEAQYLAKVKADQQAAARAAAQPAAPVSRAAPPPARTGATGVLASGDWVCPVQGPHSFTDSWGAARAGGRRHEGTDILAPMGTPIVANVSGTVRQHYASLGGPSYYLTGDDGNTYFGTHLSAYADVTGRVTAGTVIGYVGDSGDAKGTPHLHFEIHPGGGAPVNPYPTVARYC